MEATKLIAKLEKLVEEFGDYNVHYYDIERQNGSDKVCLVEVREYGDEIKIFYIE